MRGISLANPIRFVSNPLFLFQNSFYKGEQISCYAQKYQSNDFFQLCFISSSDVYWALTLKGLYSDIATIMPFTSQIGPVNYSTFNIDFVGLPEGFYQFEAYAKDLGTDEILNTFYSEPISVKESHPDTIAVNYTHNVNDFDVMYGRNFMIRVEGGIPRDGFKLESESVNFTNQPYNNVLLSGKPYSIFTYQFGIGRGIPFYLADKLNRAFCFNRVEIDGKEFVRAEGAKLEAQDRVQGLATAVYSLDVTPASNSYSEVYPPQTTISALQTLNEGNLLFVNEELIYLNQ